MSIFPVSTSSSTLLGVSALMVEAPFCGQLILYVCSSSARVGYALSAGSTEYLHLLFFTFYFLQLYCPNGISHMGNSGCLPPGKDSCDRVVLPNLGCMLGVLVFL